MDLLSQRIKNLSESQTIAMSRRSRELRAEGHDIIALSLGEPDFDTPGVIKEAAKKGIDENFSHYTAVAGYLELREAISEKFKRDNGLDYAPSQIVVSTGAKQSIANIALSLLNKGDEVLVPAPYWVSYIEIIKLAEGTPVVIPCSIDQDFKVTAEQLKAAITDKTKLLLFSTPCNPTGSVYTKEELEAIADVFADRKDIYIISDEIYELINFTGKHESIGQFDAVKDRVITVNGASKGFAMTGWRVGYIGAPQEIANACDKMQGQITSGTNSIGQKALHEAVKQDPAITHAMRDTFLKRRDLVLGLLKDIPGVKCNLPQGAFYVFPDITHYFGKSFGDQKIENATDLCMYLLDEGKVALVPGEAFGDPNCLRISYAASEEVLTEAMKRIKEALAKLN